MLTFRVSRHRKDPTLIKVSAPKSKHRAMSRGFFCHTTVKVTRRHVSWRRVCSIRHCTETTSLTSGKLSQVITTVKKESWFPCYEN